LGGALSTRAVETVPLRSEASSSAGRGEPTLPAHHAVTRGTTIAVTTTLAATKTVAWIEIAESDANQKW
jgi:hypothetical protein